MVKNYPKNTTESPWDTPKPWGPATTIDMWCWDNLNVKSHGQGLYTAMTIELTELGII